MMELMKKLVVLTIISLIILPIFSNSIVGDTPSTNSSSRQDDINDVRVYLHRDNTMDTEPPTGASQPISLSNGEEVEFVLTPALFANLKVEGRQTHGTEMGFWLDLRVRTYLVIDETSITFKVLDNQVVIAEDTTTLGANFDDDLWYLSFSTPTKQDHTFNKDHTISVNINVSISGTSPPVVVEVDSGEDNGYLTLPCNQITSITTGAYHANDKAGEFYPNLPDTEQAEDRIVKFKGDIIDTIGAYDVELVQIQVVDETELMPADYIYEDDSDSGYYELEWPYNQGISYGKKFYNVYVTDNSGNEYTSSDSFTMAKYGVHIEATNTSKYGLPGDSVSYSFDVYNIGGDTDTYSISAVSSPSTWTPSLDKSNTGSILEAGHVTVKLTVFIPTTAYENEQCTTIITVTSNSDSEPPIATDTMDFVTVAKAIYSSSVSVDKTSENIDPGDSTLFTFTITNDGDGEDTYDVFWEGTKPTGWDFQLSIIGDGTSTEIEPDKRFELYLDSGDVAEALLTVSASVNPSTSSVSITLKVDSENITEPGDKIKSLTVTVTTATGPPGELILTSLVTSKTADPGSSIEPGKLNKVYFDITLDNSDSLAQANVSMNIAFPKPSGFIFEFSEESLTVSAGAKDSVQLTVSVPEDTMYNSNGYTFSVEADYDSQSTSPLEFTVAIEKVVDAKFETAVTEKTIDWQDSAEYQLKITNLGNVKNERFEIMYSGLPDDWELILSKTSVQLGDYNSSETVTVTITPSEEVQNDEEVLIEVSIETSTGTSVGDPITLTVKVEKDFSAELGNFFEEFWIILVFVIVIIVVTAVVYKRMK
jgi:uncharacterized membrane protein